MAMMVDALQTCKLGDRTTAKVGGKVALSPELISQNESGQLLRKFDLSQTVYTVQRMVKTKYGVVLYMVGGFSVNARLCIKA